MPTVVIGNNTGDDYSGTEDAIIHGGAPTTTYGDTANLEAKYTGERVNFVIKFSGLSNIPEGSTVDSAAFYILGSNPWDNITLHARRLLRNWVESEVTYNAYSTGNNWTAAGAFSDGNDRVATASGTMAVGTTENYDGCTVTDDVGDMVAGTVSNYGWVVTRDTQDSFYYPIQRSSEYNDGSRPYLSVTYTEASGSSIVPIILAMNHFNGGM